MTTTADADMSEIARILDRAGFSLSPAPQTSASRFADGVAYRVEIPSVEGPEVLAAVLEEAGRRDVPVRRVSQGSGVMMLTDPEIREMARLGAENNVEVSLFLGPRGLWDTGAQAIVAHTTEASARGADGLAWAVAEARRACELGIRSLLVADVGVLALLNDVRTLGDLPANLLFKTSVSIPCANPAMARTLDRLGAGTINMATDLSPQQVSDIRRSTSLPLDCYIEAPDDLGGFVRLYDLPAIVAAGAPLYAKFGLRNAVSVYPSGIHLMEVAVRQAREKVRRAELGLRLLREMAPALAQTTGLERQPDLAVPEY